MEISQLQAFTLTLAIEAPVAYTLARRFRAQPRRAGIAAIAGSALTHPALWASAGALYPSLGPLTIPLLEVAIVAIEAVSYRVIATKSWRAAGLLSLVANGASYGVGLLIELL